MQVLGAALVSVLSLLSKAQFWYCVTALACASTLSTGIARAGRFIAFAMVVGYRNSLLRVAMARRDLIRAGSFGNLPDSDWLARSAAIERELAKLDHEDDSMDEYEDDNSTDADEIAKL